MVQLLTKKVFVINIHYTLNLFKCWKLQKPLFQLLIMCSLFSAWLIFKHNTILRKHAHSLMFSLGARNVCCRVFVQSQVKVKPVLWKQEVCVGWSGGLQDIIFNLKGCRSRLKPDSSSEACSWSQKAQLTNACAWSWACFVWWMAY